MDIDRPYGKSTFIKHLASKMASEYYFPNISSLGFLEDLHQLLRLMNDKHVRSYVFFRKCGLPSEKTLDLIDQGKHVIGLHLENSRSFETFHAELKFLETYLGRQIVSFSKHGSGGYKYGFHHYAPYEPEKYTQWANHAGMKVFFGNSENPNINSFHVEKLQYFPSAFWLEPHWRDTGKFTIEWLLNESSKRDIVLLFHPDNIIADDKLYEDLNFILDNTKSVVYE
jgi:hypothetical protein